MSEDTIFDKIIAKKIPADVVFEDESVLAFRDINPQAPVHVLVIPKTKYKSFDDFEAADPQLLGNYFQKIAHVAKSLGLSKSGYRVVFNHGSDGLQTVEYVHAHIIGGKRLSWPPG